jgi:hypothetical protein
LSTRGGIGIEQGLKQAQTMRHALPRKPKTRRKPREDEGPFDRFAALFEEAQKFCLAVGLPKDLILAIYHAESDWAFILKIDALLETASKEIIRHALHLKVLNRVVRTDSLAEFVDSLPINGRVSLAKLLDAAGCPSEELGFITAIRRVRNAYAHNIKFVETSLIDLVNQLPDKKDLLKNLSSIRTFVEDELVKMYEKDHKFLRFCIIDAAMRVLFYAYHLAVKHVAKK